MKNLKALTLFGSVSDRPIADELKMILAETPGLELSVEYISAHRDPEKLRERMAKNNYDLIIAGAGLAAHLPGVASSLTDKLVIGLPLSVQFSGLDSFLSIIQMPKGVPVLSVGVNKILAIRSFMQSLNKLTNQRINIMGYEVVERLKLEDKFKASLEISKIDPSHIEYSSEANKGCFNIIMNRGKSTADCSSVYLPLFSNDELEDPSLAINLLKTVNATGPSVGVNNFLNALLISKRVINLCGL